MTLVMSWLRDPDGVHHRWLGRPTIVAAWLGLTLATLSPPKGGGMALCWFQSTTGLPCLGCGLTRSMSCALHGMFIESVRFHPLGWFVLLLLITAAGTSLLPRSANDHLKIAMRARPTIFNLLYLIFASLLVGYGTVRAMLVLLDS